MKAEVLIPARPSGAVEGPALNLLDPISFWGGVSPEDGRLLDPRSAVCGQWVAGRVLLIRELRGSSSASSVLLELIHRRAAPAAILLAEPDAILALGILVGREMDWPTPPLLRLAAADQARIPDDALVTVGPDGALAWLIST